MMIEHYWRCYSRRTGCVKHFIMTRCWKKNIIQPVTHGHKSIIFFTKSIPTYIRVATVIQDT